MTAEEVTHEPKDAPTVAMLLIVLMAMIVRAHPRNGSGGAQVGVATRRPTRIIMWNQQSRRHQLATGPGLSCDGR